MDSTKGLVRRVRPHGDGAAASLRMGGPGESQPNELDHEISFACSTASAMRSGSLRVKRKGVLRKGSVFALANRGKMDRERVPRGPLREAGVAHKAERAGRPTARWMPVQSRALCS